MLHCHADMNLQDNDGNTALHLATANGHEEVGIFLYLSELLAIKAPD